MIFDVHAHLNDDRLYPIAGEIACGMKDNNLSGIVVVGYDYSSSRRAVELADEYENIYAAVGCHPHDSKSYSSEEEEFYKEVANKDKVVAVGEIGLDYHYDLSPRDVQREIFARQLRLAHELKLPVELHVRDAYGDAYEIMSDNEDCLKHGVLLHCYSGSKEMLKQFDKFDCYYSFGGPVTYKNANKEEVLRAVRSDRLLLETDCPYLAPTPKRGTDNRPEYINYTLDAVAGILGKDRERLEEELNENTKRIFFKIK